MTTKADFSEEEWTQVLEGPTSAGVLVASSDRGGTFRESFSMAKAYAEARSQHGSSELLDEIVSEKPKVDRERPHNRQELEMQTLQNVREAVALVEQRGTPEELEAFRAFVIGLAQRVAEAHKDVTENEGVALTQVAEALGTEPPSPS
jgi:hypothetical protein